jgi:UTP--glucose-1-phosphate uridylyltransferase
MDLRAEIADLPVPIRARLSTCGFDPERLARLAAPLLARADGAKAANRDERNRVSGLVEPPGPGDIVDSPQPGSPHYDRLSEAGLAAVRRGELAFCVMAGGMATRMGGVVKALVEALDGHTFLDLRLNENSTWSRRAGAPVPLWLMTSEATDEPIRHELARRRVGPHVCTFTQDVGLRLTPQGRLFRDAEGEPSSYATGHGDLPDALRRSGLLKTFIENHGKYVWIANLDNLGATIDPALLGWFADQTADLMVEVAPKIAGDRGGIPVWTDARDEASGRTVRRLQVLEEFRLPTGFDAAAVQVFNTNTFLARATALEKTKVDWTWFEVEKKVDGQVAIQFERLLQELTKAMPSVYLRVSRDGAASRFLPVKDMGELAKRRDDIAAVASTRGMMP